MRKSVSLLLLAGMLLVMAGCGGGSKSTSTNGGSTQSITVNAALKAPIEEYFKNYFHEEYALDYNENKMDNIVEKTESTQLYEKFRKTLIMQKQETKEKIDGDYQYKVIYQKCSISGDTATIALKVNLDFHYTTAPSDLRSGIHGVDYTFTLKNNGSNWLITQIDSDLEEFTLFNNEVEAKMKSEGVSKLDAGDRVFSQRLAEAPQMRNMMGSSFVAPETIVPYTNTDNKISSDDDSTINKSVFTSVRSYTYNPDCVADYAKIYWDTEDAAERSKAIFYVTGTDCTNFVSQCVWAGYVGFKSTDIPTYKNYVSKKYGMAYPEWYAGTGGGSPAWENVQKFFNYMTRTSNKDVGPIAASYTSNPGQFHRLDSISPETINKGDVIQLWYGDFYAHSIIITNKTANSRDKIYYSGHTNRRYNIQLSNITPSQGARKLTPAPTCKLKTY